MTPPRWARVPLLLGAFALVGCTSAQPAKWIAYSHANYAWGRIEAKGEVVCVPPVKLSLVDFCTEAVLVKQKIALIKPYIEAELSKAEPDWDKIMQYVGLVVNLAGKAL